MCRAFTSLPNVITKALHVVYMLHGTCNVMFRGYDVCACVPPSLEV